jgi:hypothetical protein
VVRGKDVVARPAGLGANARAFDADLQVKDRQLVSVVAIGIAGLAGGEPAIRGQTVVEEVRLKPARQDRGAVLLEGQEHPLETFAEEQPIVEYEDAVVGDLAVVRALGAAFGDDHVVLDQDVAAVAAGSRPAVCPSVVCIPPGQQEASIGRAAVTADKVSAVDEDQAAGRLVERLTRVRFGDLGFAASPLDPIHHAHQRRPPSCKCRCAET